MRFCLEGMQPACATAPWSSSTIVGIRRDSIVHGYPQTHLAQPSGEPHAWLIASQLKIDKDPASRRTVERILDVIKTSYENGKYQSPTEAERDFRQLVESENVK